MEHNIFNVDENFFVITSDNCKSVQTKMYGFMVADNGIIENDNIDSLRELSGAGTYVYVKREKESINIYRDNTGCYPLFLFKHGDWFALSNSFMLLVEYLKDKFELDFNQDFSNYMLAMDLVSEALEDTWVKQIKLLDKDAVINIDVLNSKISMSIKDWQIRSVALDSKQGVEILDKWFVRWTRLLRNLQLKTNNISTDLSGGFDSRMTFCLALMSGMDLNKIRINSIVSDRNPCFKEDFEIASEIAKKFDFELNQSKFSIDAGANFSAQDVMNINLYTRLSFHRQTEWSWISYKRKYKAYSLSGDMGGVVRGYKRNVSAEQNLEEYIKNIKAFYPESVVKKAEKSIAKIANNTAKILVEKYGHDDDVVSDVARLIQIDARSPRHFGGMSIMIHCANIYRLQPLADPELLKLQFINDKCLDSAFLVALMFERYCPDLMRFKIQGNRSIDKTTIEYAKKINELYPADINELLSVKDDKEYSIVVEDESVSEVPNGNNRVTDAQMERFLADVYMSDAFCSFIEKYIDRAVYSFAKVHFERKRGFPLACIYPIIITAFVLRIIESQKKSLDWLRTFQGRPVAFPREKFCCASIGIQSQDFDIIEISDSDVVLKSPKWFQVPSKGIMVESVALNLDLKIKSNADAKIDVYLRGADDWDVKTQANVPQWIDYTKFLCNGEIIFDDIKSVWFKKPFVFSVNVKKDEVVSLHFEWLPHREIRTEI